MLTSDPDCPFCKIVAGRDPEAREIYRDTTVLAFFPTEPATLGHTLLVPVLHYKDIWELDADIAAALGVAATRLSHAIKRAVEPEGLNVIQSNGSAATQTVQHLHVHLVPRWSDDEIGAIWPPETNYSEHEKDDVWSAIRDECKWLMANGQR